MVATWAPPSVGVCRGCGEMTSAGILLFHGTPSGKRVTWRACSTCRPFLEPLSNLFEKMYQTWLARKFGPLTETLGPDGPASERHLTRDEATMIEGDPR